MEPMSYVGLDVHKRTIQHARRRTRKNLRPRSSRACRETLCLLTKTYHGSRITGKVAPSTHLDGWRVYQELREFSRFCMSIVHLLVRLMGRAAIKL